MVDKKLLALLGKDRKYIGWTVGLMVAGLGANLAFTASICKALEMAVRFREYGERGEIFLLPVFVAMPALALRAITVFPHLLLHFDVGREFSIRALEQAMTGNREIFLVTQKDLAAENPAQEHLYQVGTVATIKQILRLPDNNVRVMVEGGTSFLTAMPMSRTWGMSKCLGRTR